MAIFLSLFFMPAKGPLESSRIFYETWISLNILLLFSNNKKTPSCEKLSSFKLKILLQGHCSVWALLGGRTCCARCWGTRSWAWALLAPGDCAHPLSPGIGQGRGSSLVSFQPFGSFWYIFYLLPVAWSDVFSLRSWGERSPLCIRSSAQNERMLKVYRCLSVLTE